MTASGKRILMVCMQYPLGPGQSYLTTELAEALVADGHRVEVLHLDWDDAARGEPRETVTGTGIRVLRCAAPEFRWLPLTLRHAAKFLLSGRAVTRLARRRIDLASFDIAIAWMPALAIAPLPRLLRRTVPHRLLFVWDFFPDHHREIGRIPGGLAFRVARGLEQGLLGCFTAIICTLPGNASYLRREYRIDPAQRVLVTPIWGPATPLPCSDRVALRSHYDLPQDRPIAVFGGQLVEGRGFEQMLAAARLGGDGDHGPLFLFVGDGRLASMVGDAARINNCIRHLPAMSRADYGVRLGACDVGLVATVPGVRSFSIPSKTIDYLRAGLPVVAAIEPGNDFGTLLQTHGVGISVPQGDPQAFRAAVNLVVKDPSARAQARTAAAACLAAVFDPCHAVATVLAAAGSVAAPPA